MPLVYGGSSRQEKPTRGRTGGSSRRSGRSRGSPLGVPKDYTARTSRYSARYAGRDPSYLQYMPTRPGAARETIEQTPRYMEGDEWKPASESVDRIIERQQKLVIGGYLDPDDGFALGRWDGATRKAYQFLLEDANAAGVTADVALYRAAQSIPIGGGGGGGEDGEGGGRGRGGGWTIDPETGELVQIPEEQFVPEPLRLQLPNMDDLRAVFRSAIVDKLGVGMSQSQINEMANAYVAQVTKVQKDAYSQMVARDRELFETGTTDINQITEVDLPNPDIFVEEEARRRDPAGFQATQVAEDYAPAFFEALGGYG